MPTNPQSTSSESIDALVVGSGFGGAVTALRLVQAGISTVMLERGKAWPITDDFNTFSSLQDPDGRSAWLSPFSVLGPPKPIDPFIGVLELSIENGIAAFAGAGVGGGSLVYAGVLYQPERALFNRVFERAVSYDEMDHRYYPRVRAELDPAPVPHRILHHPNYAAARAWLALGEMAGLRARRLDMGIDWEVVALELMGRRPASVLSGEFWYGNNSGAKRSLDTNYLRKAKRTRRLEILTQHVATQIEQTAEGRYRVTAIEIDESGAERARRQFVAKKLFLAAGSLGTSKLLVRARAKGHLPRLNDAVGRRWGNNGDFFGALTGLSERVLSGRGGTAPIAIEDHDNDIAPVVVQCYADWARENERGRVSSIGMSVVPALGTFTYDSATDDVVLNWPATHPEVTQVVDAANATYRKLADATPHGLDSQVQVQSCRGGLRAQGLKPQDARLGRRRGRDLEPVPADDFATAHPLGGVTLGEATDNVGTVINYPGLYVVDGALIPGHTGCTNPALTIAALAERNIERIIDRDCD
jgi:cholesterol oxidase